MQPPVAPGIGIRYRWESKWRGGYDRPGSRMIDFAAMIEPHCLLAAEYPYFIESLNGDPSEERREPVIVVPAPTLRRMVVAFGALQPHAQENLTRRLAPILRRGSGPVKVDGPCSEGAPAR